MQQVSNLIDSFSNLIIIEKQVTGSNQIVNRLIEFHLDKIRFSTEGILELISESPSHTSCVYPILFKDYFKTSKFHQATIDWLFTILDTQEMRYFYIGLMIYLKRLSNDQSQIIGQIINKLLSKSYAAALAFKQEHIPKKIKITTYSDIYCQNAYDKQTYLDRLVETDAQLKSGIRYSIEVPEGMTILLVLADLLNPLEKLFAWKRFLAENQRCK